jgi:hypothetical protein
MELKHIELSLRSLKGLVAVLEDIYKLEQEKLLEERRKKLQTMEIVEVINVKIR